jgi:glycosyltransferase involved in cell wall biosynthesis
VTAARTPRLRARSEAPIESTRKIAVLGNHGPRQCGIATFTTDLSRAIADESPDLDCFVLAMNDAGRHYDYPPRVRFEIAENELASYRRAADFLNVNEVDVACVQHEYGIFGGKAGSHLLTLLRELRMPIVTTLHTILAEPNPQQRAAMDELLRLSERVVVMSQYGSELLQRVHGVPPAKIDFIPHGIPRLPSARRSKDRLGLEGKSVILTLGLLSPDKGIEHVIDALPAILRRHPDAVYVVLGATHPHVKQRDGETYRLMLESRAQKLGVHSSTIFHDRFVSDDELAEFLAAADIYVTPYLKQEQITSGTLAYALGSGKAVISTPYFYARELLAEGRGVLVPWRDPAAIADAATDLLGNDTRRQAMCARAAEYGRDMVWPAVARRYMESFDRARESHGDRLRTVFHASTLATRPVDLPEPSFAHLRSLTDDTGILQHAVFSVPRYEDGYCVDDNARALLAMALVEDAGSDELGLVRALGSRYLAFVRHAYNRETGRFRNFMSYGRRFTEDVGSEDSHGRALWALGAVVGRSGDPGRRSLAGQLFHEALPALETFSSPRAWSYALLGLDEYLRAFQGESNIEGLRTALAERLHALYQRTATRDWPWFEEYLTYCNARLPHALIVSGAHRGDEAMTETGLRALGWLADLQRSRDGYFEPIGSNGFYRRGGEKAAHDQQPVEAASMIAACLDAQRLTGDARWAVHARRAFDWFLGQNSLQQVVCDAATGGCRDGLHPDRVNENQGAESTLSYLLALLDMRAPSLREARS